MCFLWMLLGLAAVIELILWVLAMFSVYMD